MAEQGSSRKDRRNELAKIRTERAERRTQLANERTFSAWVRTGLAMLIAGFAAARLLAGSQPEWLPTLVALLLIALSASTFLMALVSYRKSASRSHSRTQAWIVAALIVVLIALCGIGVFMILHVAPGSAA